MKQYTLKEIASWLTDITNKESKISLPSLQRGFVWKPFQIEKVWDSIFRGYPIGAITMSLNETNKQRILLDGHQRCISIALGHYNPLDEETTNKISNLSDCNLSLWIDLNPKQMIDDQKFVFHCSTKNISLNDSFSIPLSFLLEIGNEHELNFELFKNSLFSKLEDFITQTQHSIEDQLDYKEINNDKLIKIYHGVLNYHRLLIPEIVVDSRLVNEDNKEEIENLFI